MSATSRGAGGVETVDAAAPWAVKRGVDCASEAQGIPESEVSLAGTGMRESGASVFVLEGGRAAEWCGGGGGIRLLRVVEVPDAAVVTRLREEEPCDQGRARVSR